MDARPIGLGKIGPNSICFRPISNMEVKPTSSAHFVSGPISICFRAHFMAHLVWTSLHKEKGMKIRGFFFLLLLLFLPDLIKKKNNNNNRNNNIISWMRNGMEIRHYKILPYALI